MVMGSRLVLSIFPGIDSGQSKFRWGSHVWIAVVMLDGQSTATRTERCRLFEGRHPETPLLKGSYQ